MTTATQNSIFVRLAPFMAAIENRMKTSPEIIQIAPVDTTPGSLMHTSEQLSAVAHQIAASLQATPRSGQVAPIPETEKLIDLVLRLKAIVYPGFRSNETSPHKVLTDLHLQLAHAHKILSEQIGMAIARHWEACEAMGEISSLQRDAAAAQIEKQAIELATLYLQKLPQIREILLTDVQAAYDGDPACRNRDEVILCYPGLQAITVHRLAHELHLLGVPFLPRMMAEWIHGETGIDIHPGAQIGHHFFIDHGTGVVIGETCEIGNFCKIYQGVTLGALSFPQDNHGNLLRQTKRHPTLGDRVVIYANATVLGGETIIGNDSVIGSSVWLTSGVDPFTTVIMEKPKLRLRSQSES